MRTIGWVDPKKVKKDTDKSKKDTDKSEKDK